MLSALGSRVVLTQVGAGMSWRGEAQVVSGDVLRKLLVQMETKIEVEAADLADEEVETPVGRLTKRGPRCDAKKGQVDVREAQGRGQGVATQLLTWYRDDVSPPSWPLPNWARDVGCISWTAPKWLCPLRAATKNAVGR